MHSVLLVGLYGVHLLSNPYSTHMEKTEKKLSLKVERGGVTLNGTDSYVSIKIRQAYGAPQEVSLNVFYDVESLSNLFDLKQAVDEYTSKVAKFQQI